MSSEDSFEDKPMADIDEETLAKALDNEHVFERSSAPPAVVKPLNSGSDEFPDEPEPESEPMPEPQPLNTDVVDPLAEDTSEPIEKTLEQQSSYGRTDPASLAAVGSGELRDAQLGPAQDHELAQAELGAAEDAQSPSIEVELGQGLPEALVSQPHLAHLAQVGLTDADTWEEQIKPRIEHLHEQIDEVNIRLDHLTTPKRKYA
jgi:hypothetical protein